MDVIVLKVGGSILKKLPDEFYKTIIALKEEGNVQPVIVHGGGPEINEALEKMQVKNEFVDGLRVTTDEVLHVAESMLSGAVNKQIVRRLQQCGGTGLGLSGVDAGLLKVKEQDPTGRLGFVGDVREVNTALLYMLMEQGIIPVVSPIGLHDSGKQYNVNGDMAAAAVAASLEAKLVLISDIPGVLEEVNGEKIIHPALTETQIEEKIASGIIYGGMIPKVKSALKALAGGMKESVIINGLQPEDLTAYLEGKPVGTRIIKSEVHHV